MKRIIKASSINQLPITELTEDEISSLPENVVVMTRMPSTSSSYIFKIVNKEKLRTPHKCLAIPSWGYALGQEVYLASKDEVRESYDEKIDKLKEEQNKMVRFAL